MVICRAGCLCQVQDDEKSAEISDYRQIQHFKIMFCFQCQKLLICHTTNVRSYILKVSINHQSAQLFIIYGNLQKLILIQIKYNTYLFFCTLCVDNTNLTKLGMFRFQPARIRGNEISAIEPRVRTNSDQCPGCGKFITGLHQCKVACHYCHDLHHKNDLVENMCPLVYPFAKKEQEKHSYQCKSCKGEGSYTQEVETIKYETNKKYDERVGEWAQLKIQNQNSQEEWPIRRILHKEKTTKEVDCFECQGKGRIMRMIFCCNSGCRSCNGDKYIINPMWKKYRKQPMINQHIFHCAICLMDVEQAGQKYMLNCGHQFHPDCIFKWMKTKKNCPVCRQIDFYIEGIEFPEFLQNLVEERRDQAQRFIQYRGMRPDSQDSWGN